MTAIGSLAWRTPTGAMLWEMWARHKMNFLWHGLALAVSLFFVRCKQSGVSEIPAALLTLASLACFLAAYLQLLACFAYVEMDAGKVTAGYPARLLLKPVRTVQLVLVPMLSGGLVTTVLFILWLQFVLKPLGFLPSQNPAVALLWTSAVALSFLWWMQALAWSLPLGKIRSLGMILLVAIHFFAWVMHELPGSRIILAALIVSALFTAWIGLKWMRYGKWESPFRLSSMWSWVRLPQTRSLPRKFSSAFAAQFWLEWRRQGWLLPGFVGAVSFVLFPLLTFFFKCVGVGDGSPPPPATVLSLMLIGPLLLSGILGAELAKFDRLSPTREMPVYLAVRPMTNGGFVIAKLAMALATSVLTCLLAVAGACLSLADTGQGNLFSKTGLVTPFGPVAYLTICLPVLVLLVIMTWKNLLAAISAGLTGRPWLVNVSTFWRGLLGAGLIAVVMAAKLYENFKESLLHWLTAILIVCLVVKLTVSITAFVLGLRRNAITISAIAWIVGGWLVCGGFVAGYAGHVCITLNKPDLRLWLVLGAFLFLPLTELAIAPLALAWNRHR